MLEYNITEQGGIKKLQLSGRIDSQSSSELDVPLKELGASGERKIPVSFEKVSYISSAGLRVFLFYQKELKKVGGELILYGLNDSIFNVFKISGFDRLFNINQYEANETKSVTEKISTVKKEIKGISFEIMKQNEGKEGIISSLGSEAYLSTSSYREEHVLPVNAENIPFGLGLASLGENYEEYKNYFGEAVVVNNNLFVYSAVKKPSVDFMTYSGDGSSVKYPFFYGLSFNGQYRYVASFQKKDGFINLPELLESCFQISRANLIGIVLLAESKGLWGMNLKKIPIIENKPEKCEDIFHYKYFPEWMNFSIEPEDIDRVILGCGVTVKDRSKISKEMRNLIPEKNNFHIHGCIFEQGLFNKEPSGFNEEIKRIIFDLEPLSVKHIMAKSLFSSGIIGIIEMEPNI